MASASNTKLRTLYNAINTNNHIYAIQNKKAQQPLPLRPYGSSSNNVS